MTEYEKHAKRATRAAYLFIAMSFASYVYATTTGEVALGYAAGIVGGSGIGLLHVKRVYRIFAGNND